MISKTKHLICRKLGEELVVATPSAGGACVAGSWEKDPVAATSSEACKGAAVAYVVVMGASGIKNSPVTELIAQLKDPWLRPA